MPARAPAHIRRAFRRDADAGSAGRFAAARPDPGTRSDSPGAGLVGGFVSGVLRRRRAWTHARVPGGCGQRKRQPAYPRGCLRLAASVSRWHSASTRSGPRSMRRRLRCDSTPTPSTRILRIYLDRRNYPGCRALSPSSPPPPTTGTICGRGWWSRTARARSNPAPLLLVIHGGPEFSWNGWSWRWCPWLFAARGYAVLLPDPALSTGYGQEFLRRGWGSWGDRPYTDLMAVTDAAEKRSELDATRTAALGGSFGGYMANWVAGHTDRFRAIVTHASLWSLEQFAGTTDFPAYWTRRFGDPVREPERYRDYSPNRLSSRSSRPCSSSTGTRTTGCRSARRCGCTGTSCGTKRTRASSITQTRITGS